MLQLVRAQMRFSRSLQRPSFKKLGPKKSAADLRSTARRCSWFVQLGEDGFRLASRARNKTETREARDDHHPCRRFRCRSATAAHKGDAIEKGVGRRAARAARGDKIEDITAAGIGECRRVEVPR